MIGYLQALDEVYLHLGHEVEDITRQKDGKWKIDDFKLPDILLPLIEMTGELPSDT